MLLVEAAVAAVVNPAAEVVAAVVVDMYCRHAQSTAWADRVADMGLAGWRRAEVRCHEPSKFVD